MRLSPRRTTDKRPYLRGHCGRVELVGIGLGRVGEGWGEDVTTAMPPWTLHGDEGGKQD